MELNLCIKSKDDLERFVLIANIGLMAAIRMGAISIKEAEDYLYSPYSIEKIRNIELNEDIVKLVELGCELEDVESLIPNRLDNFIDEISNKSIELLRSIPKSAIPTKKWID